jgi:UDP-xylose/UDP-N-acetylglucosamine transporter B4
MILGILLLHKRYTLREYISVVLISIGIFVSTLASSNDMKKKETTNINPDQQQGDHEYLFFFWWVVGISMLTVALLISAGMGLVQEKLYRENGKHPDEALYYIVLMIFFTQFAFNFGFFT